MRNSRADPSGHNWNRWCVHTSLLLSRGNNREYLKAWDIQTGELKKNFEEQTSAVWCSVVVDGVLYTGGEDGLIKAWDATTFACVKTLAAHEGRVRTLHYSAEEARLYSGGHDSKAIISTLWTLRQKYNI